MKRYAAALAAGLALLSACIDTTGIPDLNNPDLGSVSGTLTKENLQTLFTGILNEDRGNVSSRYIVFTETLARDALRMDNSEPRYISELLENPPSTGGFIASAYTEFFVAVRATRELLAAIPDAPENVLSAGDKSLVSGFLRTIEAQNLYRLAETRDTLGIPFEQVTDVTQPAPIRCKPQVLAYISSLLDSAYTELQAAQAAGSTTMPLQMPGGWTSIGGDYSQVDNIIKYNRGLKGKVEVYRGLDSQSPNPGSFAAAVEALDIALADETGETLDAGPYYQYSTAAGETDNPLYDSKLHLTPAVGDSIQPGDDRASKIITQSTPWSQKVDGVQLSTPYDFFGSVATDGANQTRPIGILRNEELVLLRAQAEIGLNDLAAATADLNLVRVNSGGLTPYATFTSTDAAIDALLYEKRYSLLFEGPQRLVDLRAYGRLNSTSFPQGGNSSPYEVDPYNSVLPFPQAESNARNGDLSVTCS